LPTGYTLLNWLGTACGIENSVYMTSYIDIGVNQTKTITIEFEMAFSNNSPKEFLQTGTIKNYSGVYRFHFGANQAHNLMMWQNTSSTAILETSNDEQFHTYKLTPTQRYFDGTLLYTGSSASSNVPITIFARNSWYGASNKKIDCMGEKDNNTLWKQKFKHGTISDGNTTIRDVYPAMRNSDSVLGLFDIVNNTFYTNQGNKDFIYG
jgi:hypothetical protein